MFIKYIKTILFKNQFKKLIDLYNKHYFIYKSKQFTYFKERLCEKSCYDCKYLMLRKDISCNNLLNDMVNTNDMPDIKGCIYYSPNKKVIKRNFLIK